MDWGSIVLVVEILLLVAGWLLFQQAKSDLTARAAETPVLSEIRELQKSVALLIEQIRLESGQASAQLEARCLEARELLTALDRRLDGASPRPALREVPTAAAAQPQTADCAADAVPQAREADIYALADRGLGVSAIARESGLPEGEVELILGLRQDRGAQND